MKSNKFDPTAKPLLFTNGVKAYINKNTNLLFLAKWLLKRGCRIPEMPWKLRKVARKYLAHRKMQEDRLKQRVALAVRYELEGLKPSEIAAKLRMAPSYYLAFRNHRKELFIAELDRIATDTRMQALSTFLNAERRMTKTMPKAVQAIDEIIVDKKTPPAVRSRTALELIKIMRQHNIADRIAEIDGAFGAIAQDTALADPILTKDTDYEAPGEFLESDEVEALPAAGTSEEAEGVGTSATADGASPNSDELKDSDAVHSVC